MLTIAPLGQADPVAVEALLDAAFGADRRQRLTSYRLRGDTDWLPALSFAAFDTRALIATIQCTPIELTGANGGVRPIILVGPVAVSPDRQRDGIGRRLMEAMLHAADAGGPHDLILIGDPEYYGRFFGFTAAATAGWTVPGPVDRHRLLARLAQPDTWPASGALGPCRSPLAATG